MYSSPASLCPVHIRPLSCATLAIRLYPLTEAKGQWLQGPGQFQKMSDPHPAPSATQCLPAAWP